jgi:hypothetical protein
MGGEFAGEVARYYQKYRRGYRAEVIDLLRPASDSRVLDLGCGAVSCPGR